MNLSMDDESSEGELEESQVLASPMQMGNRGYDSCDNEDMESGFLRYRENNLATWLGLRLPWAGWCIRRRFWYPIG